MGEVIAYHFTGDTLRDGRPIPPLGETLVHDGPVQICRSGLHASECPFDALRYAPGPMLHRVKCEGIKGREDDKLVCRRRTILASVDASFMLRRFAADQALSVAHLWDMPEIVRDYLTTLDGSKQDAARAAASAAVRDAARAAASAAVRDAASAAVSAAAWAAAWAAASAAVRDAAWAAASAAARDDFRKRVASEFGEHHG